MNYNNYPYRDNFADSVFSGYYDYWADYDKEYERFDYSKLTKKEKEALREWSNFNGSSGEREDAPYLAMNSYVKQLLTGTPASKIKGVSRKHKKQVHTISSIMARYSQPILHAPLYRGMKTIPESFQGKSIGDIATIDSIIAVSTSSVAIPGFAHSNGSVMIIRDACGIVGWHKGEHELLLAPGSKFRITDIYRADWDTDRGDLLESYTKLENLTVFEVDMVPDENKLHLLDKARRWWGF